MIKEEKLHNVEISILTINMDGLYHNQFLMVDLIMLKIYQYVHT